MKAVLCSGWIARSSRWATDLAIRRERAGIQGESRTLLRLDRQIQPLATDLAIRRERAGIQGESRTLLRLDRQIQPLATDLAIRRERAGI